MIYTNDKILDAVINSLSIDEMESILREKKAKLEPKEVKLTQNQEKEKSYYNWFINSGKIFAPKTVLASK